MAGCKKRNSKLQEANYKRYAIEGKAGINRLNRMKRELKKNPENLQLVEQLKKGNTGYTRKKPKVSILTNAKKTAMQTVKYFTGSGHRDLVSTVALTHIAAWRKLVDSKKRPKEKVNPRMFSIGCNLPENTVKLLESLKLQLSRG